MTHAIVKHAAAAIAGSMALAMASPAVAADLGGQTAPVSAELSQNVASGADILGDMSFDKKRHRKYRKRHHHRGHYDRHYRGHHRYRHAYGEPVYRNTRIWRGRDGRYYCRRENGTTGLLVGAGVGGLIGHEVAGHGGDRTLGAILGAAGGAILGRAIDRSDRRCR